MRCVTPATSGTSGSLPVCLAGHNSMFRPTREIKNINTYRLTASEPNNTFTAIILSAATYSALSITRSSVDVVVVFILNLYISILGTGAKLYSCPGTFQSTGAKNPSPLWSRRL